MIDQNSVFCQPISVGQNFLWLHLPQLLPMDSNKNMVVWLCLCYGDEEFEEEGGVKFLICK